MGTMGLVGGTIMLMVPVQQLPVRPLLQVVCQRHLIDGSVRAHHSLCMAQGAVNQWSTGPDERQSRAQQARWALTQPTQLNVADAC